MESENKQKGNFGEQLAKKYLLERGYYFIASNFSYNKLEIDLIFEDRDKKLIIFVEVKTRSSKKFGLPEDAIDTKKQKNIRIASGYFLKFNKEFLQHRKRFDSLSVLLNNNDSVINHIENAF